MYQNLFLFVLSLSPLYNRTDWQGVKHQFTYLPTLLSFFNGFVVVCFVSSFTLACRLTSITSRSMYHTPGLWRGQRRTIKGWWSPSRPAPWWSSRAGTACATWPRSTPSWASATPFRWELLFGQFFSHDFCLGSFFFVFLFRRGLWQLCMMFMSWYVQFWPVFVLMTVVMFCSRYCDGGVPSSYHPWNQPAAKAMQNSWKREKRKKKVQTHSSIQHALTVMEPLCCRFFGTLATSFRA